MIRRPPRSTRTDTLFPYTTLFRSTGTGVLVMANRNVEIFDNVFDNNGTANVMIVGYRYEHKDPKYQPLPKQIVVRGNQHGKAGYAPKFPGGDQIAAAMGGRTEERRVGKECVG